MTKQNPEFQLGGINHLALVCRDMEKTVDFYTNVLGMPLIKTIEFPGGAGQHFFFDIGNGDCLAFFWFPNAPEPMPGVSSAAALPGLGDLTTAIGSMNHVAFGVPADKIEEYRNEARRQGHQVQPGDQPRSQRARRHRADDRRRVHPVGVLLRPRRRAPRVRVLDGRADRGRRQPRTGARDLRPRGV